MQTSQRLKKLRKKSGLTQEELAKIIKVTQSQYNHYESGRSDITKETLIKLCKHYNISADYILGLTEEQKKLF